MRQDAPTFGLPALAYYEQVSQPGPARPRRPPRNFAISDLMILVAGSALGCAWTRANWQMGQGKVFVTTLDTWRTTWPIMIQLPTPLLFSVGFAALACRFTPPRPPFEQIARQPGVIALAILSFVLSIHAAVLTCGILGSVFFASGRPEDVLVELPFLLPDTTDLFSYQIIGAGPSVIVCWCIQLVIHQWEPERSWIDRTGRALGVALILIEFGWLLEFITR